MNIAITTTRNPDESLINKAYGISKELDIPYVKRGNYSINKISEMNKIECFLFVEKDKIVLKGEDNAFFWHPNTSEIKMKAIKEGLNQPMVEAMDLKSGDRVLDCTLGLATDAIVFASIVGENGMVVGTEVNKYIACITKNGLKDYEDVDAQTKIFMDMIDVINSSYEDYILSMPDNSFDVVYFDPMFKIPNKKSVSINALRPFAHQEGLKKETLMEALRVCKNRVVIKERVGSGEFERLGIQKCYGNSKFGSIAYGVIEK
ncbi:class I SAM-dependent methyltransferase [Clostridium gasigenes]|uniref:class I SAM-dependent methyltransferase n=1 Tax=Clostridium gasigenes TaxID=94869 RepID=UPI001438265B|nr:class I SAM-dependent methyltransferase [Clostridium gasigenes]NKF08528.1 class I SAM-dependent methyltransferase [Clostridium gasigenes]QSW19541.1 class I SAM-dependent methyltransferase [Clostridium gasigenes]